MNELDSTHVSALRSASIHDAESIHALLKVYSDRGNLLPRTIEDIETNVADFWVIDMPGQIVGCAALELFPNQLGEVRSLAVSPNNPKTGLGRLLVQNLINEARRRGLTRLMALTYVPEFFHKLGFRTVPKAMLPEKVWGICVRCYKFYNCDETAVLLYL